MVGSSDIFGEISDAVFQIWPRVKILPIIGMAGIGKTTIAKKILEDPLIKENFECRIFVLVGQKSQLKNILQAVVAQVNTENDKTLVEEDDMWECLVYRKFFIVLDDVWSIDLLRGILSCVPRGAPGGMILVTTRLQRVGRYLVKKEESDALNMRFMNKEESWALLREKVFGEEVCPPQLEKAGKKIAENCEGLPLLIVTVAGLLSEAERTLEYWNKVAANEENSLFEEAYDQVLEVMYPSYNYLPQFVKPCFLYMSVFPQNYEVRLSRLDKLLAAEEFLNIYQYGDPVISLNKYLEHLVFGNSVVVHPKGFRRNRVKAYSFHSVFWHLCRKEAGKNQFLHTLNRCADGFAENIERQRRLSIYRNVLLGIEDVYNSVKSVSNARSLLCTGAYHHYQVPICFGSLRLLRVLDALTIRFYEFPMELLKLVQLRYLAITSNGNLPPPISKLWNLQCLIVYQHLSIKFTLLESYLSVEIWDLQELKHLQIMGRNLPDPPHGAVLPNLLTLLGVGAHSCNNGVLQSIPKLKKLRVQIELMPDSAEPLTCFDRVSCDSRSLNSLRLVVVNPNVASEIAAPPLPPISDFASCLTKLTLSGFGYPWKDINKFAELPFLQVLKLQCYAFRGEKWVAKKEGFVALHYLLIEDTDLVRWTVGQETFPFLRYLAMKHCYKIQKLPYISSLQEIELVDCSSSAVAFAKQRQLKSGHQLHVYSSWDDKNIKS